MYDEPVTCSLQMSSTEIFLVETKEVLRRHSGSFGAPKCLLIPPLVFWPPPPSPPGAG